MSGGIEGTGERSMTELIERLEKLEGPDRKVDGDIAMMTGPWTKYDLGDDCWQWRYNGINFGTRPKEYTASLDAALTLVPEGWEGTVGVNKSTANIFSTNLAHPDFVFGNGVIAATPAIALVIAALKARAALACAAAPTPTPSE